MRKVGSMIGYYLQYRFGGRENDGDINFDETIDIGHHHATRLRYSIELCLVK